MAEYHFFKEPPREEVVDFADLDEPDRIVVDYTIKKPSDEKQQKLNKHFGNFLKSHHYSSGKKTMVVGNCEGSLIVVDSERETELNPINKLHIGKLVGTTPHAEAYEHHGIKGCRVDLAKFDIKYALQMYTEMIRWLDPIYKVEARKKHESRQWYSVQYRLKQLDITNQGLERKISELHEYIEELKKDPKRRLVSSNAAEIERESYAMVGLMNLDILYQHSKKTLRIMNGLALKREANEPKIIINPDVFTIASEIQSRLKTVFNHICPKIDVQQAKNYWPLIEAWGKM